MKIGVCMRVSMMLRFPNVINPIEMLLLSKVVILV